MCVCVCFVITIHSADHILLKEHRILKNTVCEKTFTEAKFLKSLNKIVVIATGQVEIKK